MAELKIAALNALVTYGVPIIALLLTVIAGYLSRLIVKFINKYLKLSFLETLDGRIQLMTLALKETVVKDAKEKAKDGKITPEELKEFLANTKKAAIDELMKQFGPELASAAGLIGDPTKYLADKIEEMIVGHKVNEAVVKASIANPQLPAPVLK